MTTFPKGFIWGAASSAHQIEGNNLNSDWWAREQSIPGMQLSGDALDSYHRYDEDMRLLAEAGLDTYRFGIEWARIEPIPGHFSKAELAHYRRMIETAQHYGLTPVVSVHHGSSPKWFDDEGGFTSDRAIDRFSAYVTEASTILDDVKWICTINEPNMLAVTVALINQYRTAAASGDWASPTVQEAMRVMPGPDADTTSKLIAVHQAARTILKQRTNAHVGWTIANEGLVGLPGYEDTARALLAEREDPFLIAARDDDFIGVQAYSVLFVGATGIIPHPESPENTLVNTAYRPDALGVAVRHAWDITQGTPVLVTENGIATADDDRRIAYTSEALHHLADTIDEGIDVRGYLHWSALDNFEWGHWEPTFGLIAVDRDTFVRTPKPSLAWLGDVARTNGESLPPRSKD